MAMIKKKTPKKNSADQAKQWNRKLSISEYTHRRMIFGKYTNWFIKDLPIDYLKWAILNLDSYWSDFMARELQRRDASFK